MKNFRANGKLLITAEYSVLRGAKALAVPTRFGQALSVEEGNGAELHWQSVDVQQQTWFEAVFSSALEIVSTSDNTAAKTLQQILQTAKQLNARFNPNGVWVKTKLEFNRQWGLGSSSTLIALIAQWAEVDALTLFFKTLSGSGYDVACALVNHPITYQLANNKAIVNQADFNPVFKDDLHFIYLGQKQKSDKEVARFSSLDVEDQLLNSISSLTNRVITASTLDQFEELLTKHEELTGKLIGLTPIQKQHFSDYPGVIKSLGAWGGDFVMVTRLADSPKYFANKNYTTILSWDEMIGM
jgi:mevalonate kinase